MDFGLVNAFLACEDLTESEQMLRQNVVGLDSLLKRLTEERATATETLKVKEQELLKVQGALENQLAVVQQLAKRRGLEPLLQESDADETASETIEQSAA